MTRIKENAYAKINLFLDIVGVRDDGFHDIKTIMHSVTLSDDVIISVHPSGNRVVRMSLDSEQYLPLDNKNLAVRAAYSFLEALDLTYEVRIKLVKRIPIAAGLAGGSSDAAAVLRGLNRLLGKPMSRAKLLELALAMGSDVPYCLIGGSALCQGRGEIMSPISLPKMYFVIAIADEHISAKDAYSGLDKMYNGFDGSAVTGGEDVFLRCYASGATCTADKIDLFNVFESVVLPICPGASAIKAQLLALGAKNALMSGSGPAVFGIFESREHADSAALAIRDAGYFAASVQSV